MSSPFEPGSILAGKFRIERVLGQGGMGVVVAATHIQLDERVAIKFLLPEALASKEAVTRFEREARAAVKIKSEHIARVSDVGTLENGAPYMVMEYLQGRDLGAVIEDGRVALEDAADYVLQACEAVAEAHSLGIVHRDLKPPNLFLIKRADGSPCVKVLDFGISKVSGGAGHGMTSTGLVMGSPLYMSPEQLASAKDVDMRADVWSLGIILYELLTGQVPFNGESIGQLCTAILTAAPTPLATHRPDLPKGVEEMIFACLEKDRARRTATVSQLASTLVNFAPKGSRLSAERIERMTRAAGFLGAETPPAAQEPKAQPAGGQTSMGFARTGAKVASSKWMATAGAVAAVAVLGVVLATRHSPAPEAPSPAAKAVEAPPAVTVPPAPPPVAPVPTEAPKVIPAVAPAPSAAEPVAEAPKLVAKKPRAAAAQKPAAAKPAAAPAAPVPAAPKPPADSLGGRM